MYGVSGYGRRVARSTRGYARFLSDSSVKRRVVCRARARILRDSIYLERSAREMRFRCSIRSKNASLL